MMILSQAQNWHTKNEAKERQNALECGSWLTATTGMQKTEPEEEGGLP